MSNWRRYLKTFIFIAGGLVVVFGMIIAYVWNAENGYVNKYIYKTIDSVNRIQLIKNKFKNPETCATATTNLDCFNTFFAFVGEYQVISEIPMVLVTATSICLKYKNEAEKVDKTAMKICLFSGTKAIVDRIDYNKLWGKKDQRAPSSLVKRQLLEMDVDLMNMTLRKLRVKLVAGYAKEKSDNLKVILLKTIASIDAKIIELRQYQ